MTSLCATVHLKLTTSHHIVCCNVVSHSVIGFSFYLQLWCREQLSTSRPFQFSCASKHQPPLRNRHNHTSTDYCMPHFLIPSKRVKCVRVMCSTGHVVTSQANIMQKDNKYLHCFGGDRLSSADGVSVMVSLHQLAVTGHLAHRVDIFAIHGSTFTHFPSPRCSSYMVCALASAMRCCTCRRGTIIASTVLTCARTLSLTHSDEDSVSNTASSTVHVHDLRSNRSQHLRARLS